MLIYPAIDILGGACVRLRQGRYDAVTEYSRDPVAMAQRFVDEGAEALHVVDLDGARIGSPSDDGLILKIRERCALRMQVGGGLRTGPDASRLLDAGVQRVILGTRALTDPDGVAELLTEYGSDRIVAAVDAREGRVLGGGWLEDGRRDVTAHLDALADLGITDVVYTDVTRDGTMSAPDLEGTRRVIRRGFRTVASGGIATLADLRALREGGAAGAVLGSALYRDSIRLGDAIQEARGSC